MSHTDYLFPPAPQAAVAIADTDMLYPVRRIFCVGRNYAAHAAEMGGVADKENPFYFTKTPSTLIASGATIPYPPGTGDYHHEIELVVAIGGPAFEVGADTALTAVYGYACGLDMTRRDLQSTFKAAGRPWDLAKDIEDGAVISPLRPAATIGHPTSGTVELSVNGAPRQRGDIADMINSVAEVIADLSRFYHLNAGDLIYTGTPSGVGAVVSGDDLTGHIDGVGDIRLTIA